MMGSATFSYLAAGSFVAIRGATLAEMDAFVALAKASAGFVLPWIVLAPESELREAYARRIQLDTNFSVLVCEVASGELAGVINISSIVRGGLQSAYLGYWIGPAFARRGYMREGLKLLIHYAFDTMKLHRLEANIQPANAASIALVRSCGFVREGYSPKYLHILGEWRDHERWAIRTDLIAAADSSLSD